MRSYLSRLRVRAVLLILLVVSPAVGLVLYTAFAQRQHALADARREARQLVTLIANEQERAIEAAHQLLLALAQLPSVRRHDAGACRALFGDIARKFPQYTTIAAVTTNGDVFCSATPFSGPVNVADRPYFRQALETRTLGISGGYQRGRLTGKPVLVLAYPSAEDGERVRSIVLIGLSLGWLQQFAVNAALPPGSLFAILDGGGTVVSHYPDPERWSGTSVAETPLARVALSQLSGVADVSGPDGVPRIFAFRPLSGGDRSGARVVVGIPTAAVVAAANRILAYNLAGLALMAAALLAVAWVGSELALLRPVQTLLGVTRQLTAGDLRARVGPPYRGELGELARAFDDLAAGLEERTAERRRAEEVLRESEERFRSAFDESAVGMALQTLDGRYLRVNRALCGMLGYSEPELLATTYHATTDPADRDADAEFDRRMLAGEMGSYQREKRYLHARGHVVWALVNVSLVHARDGSPLAYLLQSQDVTSRKQAQDALRASEERFRSVAQSARDAVIVASEAGDIVFWNRSAQAMFGYAGDELLDRPLTQLMPDRYHEAHRAGLERLRRGGESHVLGQVAELHGRRADGTEFPVELSLASWEADGRRFFSGLIHDVTDRKRREQLQAMDLAVTRVLAESASLGEAIARLLEAICVGAGWDLAEMWAVDADEKVLRWEGAWHEPSLEADEFLALSRETTFLPGAGLPGRVWVGGEPVWNGNVLTDPQFVRTAGARALGLHGAVAFPVSGTRVMGVIVCFSRASRPRDDRLLGTMRDVSSRIGHFLERKRGEETVRQSEQQVRQLQRLEAVGRLAGGVAHDFNNLLTVVLGRTYLLLARPQLDEGLRQEIDLIRHTADRAAVLTKQLLAFSRKQVLAPTVLDLNGVMANLTTMLKRLIGEDIDLVIRSGSALGRVKADPGQLEQVIVNLAVNARDAMREGGRLTLETANAELDQRYARQHIGVRPGPYVMLAVSDTGIGMDGETQARIFEPFFTTKAPDQGTGLGLSTVYGIVKQSGGNIWVYSEPGRGTTFKIYLPRVDEMEAAGEPVVARPGRGTETVLLVEDDDEVRTIAREILEQSGYMVLAARHPAEAMEIAERYPGPLHLMVTDVVMPQMSGRRLADGVASLRPGMKVLYMSGYTDHAIVHQGTLDADTPFIQKPFTPDTLARKAREVLDARARTRG